MSDIQNIKELRERTGLGFVACKEALDEVGGDIEKAVVALKERGAEVAAKKSERALGAGVVDAYIHATKQIGTLVELRTETDFVAKNSEFVALAHDIAMHVAATSPESVEDLLSQDYVKDPSTTVKSLIEGAIQKFGENIEVGEMVRIAL
jgi:elongation factor Ts